MREVRLIMGMPVTVEVAGDAPAVAQDIEEVFAYFSDVDRRFSTYKEGSEISRINRGELQPHEYSQEMAEIFALAEQTKRETNGYFDIRRPSGEFDPSGVVKSWAILGAARLLREKGYENFFVDAGGDSALSGRNAQGQPWSVGVRNPFNQSEIVKVLYPHGAGVATSGSYARGAHIYNPHEPSVSLEDIVSLTVVGPDVLEADRFATAAFAMGADGIHFIESLPGFEGYAIDAHGMATLTSGFSRYTNAC